MGTISPFSKIPLSNFIAIGVVSLYSTIELGVVSVLPLSLFVITQVLISPGGIPLELLHSSKSESYREEVVSVTLYGVFAVISTFVPEFDLPGKLSGLGDNSDGPVTLIWKSLGRSVPPSSLITRFMTLKVADSSSFVMVH